MGIGNAGGGGSVTHWGYVDDRLTVDVINRGAAWIVNAKRKVLGKLWISYRCGFEVDNVFQRSIFDGTSIVQAWFPVPGYELRAPVAWAIVPTWFRAR